MRTSLLISCFMVMMFWGSPSAGQHGIPHSPKIDPHLANAVDRICAAGVTPSTTSSVNLEQFSTPLVHVDRQGKVQVYVHLDKLDDAAVGELQSAGVIVELTNSEYRIVQGWLSFDLVDRVAELANVQRIRPPDYAAPRSRIDRSR